MDRKSVDWLQRLRLLIKELDGNGVKTDFQMEIITKIGHFKLDFSEHDKVFEDKIAELEKIINYKLGDWDKHGITYQEILDMLSQNDKLKKEISDLESLMQKRDEFLEIKNIQIEELKQRIEELESQKTIDLPFDPMECANYLINATYERETSSLERAFEKVPNKVNSDKYTIDDLEQIAEHLLVYCKHNKEDEE